LRAIADWKPTVSDSSDSSDSSSSSESESSDSEPTPKKQVVVKSKAKTKTKSKPKTVQKVCECIVPLNPGPVVLLAAFSLYTDFGFIQSPIVFCLIIHAHASRAPQLDTTIDLLRSHPPGHLLQKIRPRTDLKLETQRPKMHSPHSTYAK